MPESLAISPPTYNAFSAQGATIDKSCPSTSSRRLSMALTLGFNIQQGVSYTPGSTQPVGHLLSANICGTALAADLTVTNPQTGNSIPAAGVLEEIYWGEGVGDPISMTAFVSAHNQSALRQLLQTIFSITAVTVTFATHEYDQEVHSWFAAFAPVQPPLSGLIQGKENPQLIVDSTATVWGSAQLYKMYFAMVPPANKAQYLRLANSTTTQVTKPWGLTVGTITGSQTFNP
jgi:hypothetical protein